jgi:hypothetical protein
MLNKKVLSKIDLGSYTKPNPFHKDIIYDPKGQWEHPGQNTRIPGGDITMQGVPYPVYAQPNIGQPQMMYPDQNYQFPGADYVDEFPQMKKGGRIKGLVSMPKPSKKGLMSNKYSRSLDATNKLFTENFLFAKPKSRKNKVFDPNAKYYAKGGALLTKEVTCKKCGWEWDAADGGKDITTCHKCNGQGLIHAQKGGSQIYKYADRPEATYKKDAKGNWLINLPSTKGEYVPIKDPTGKRAGELNEKAKPITFKMPVIVSAEEKYHDGPLMGIGQNINGGDGIMENIFEVVDPSGITSWDDIARSYKKEGMSPNTWLEIAGAIPLVGKAAKASAAGIHLAKYKGLDKLLYNMLPKSNTVSRTLKGAGYAGRGYDGYQVYDEANRPYSLNNMGPKYEEGGEYFELDLTPEEIQQYAEGGFIVEDISIPSLSQMQDGGDNQSNGETYKYLGRPDSLYKKSLNGRWSISNKSTGNKFVSIEDPKGSRTKELDKNAVTVSSLNKKRRDHLIKLHKEINFPKEFVDLKDTRTVRATTGEKINPNVDLKADKYNKVVIDNIIKKSKAVGVDPSTMLAIALQETNFGKKDANLGHALYGDTAYPYGYIDFYKEKLNEAKRAKIDNELLQIQYYNGLGTVYPETEEDYHGFKMQKIYGVPLPASGINMRKNPLYGKQIIDLRDNVVLKNPYIQKALKEKKQGGASNDYVDVDLTPEEIKDLIAQGYVIEELN